MVLEMISAAISLAKVKSSLKNSNFESAAVHLSNYRASTEIIAKEAEGKIEEIRDVANRRINSVSLFMELLKQ